MRILVWGLGHVGAVNAACLAELGHDVVGIDSRPEAVAAIQGDRPLMREPGLHDLVARNVAAGRLRATREGTPEVRTADVSLVCVGIPESATGGLFLDPLRSVAAAIGGGLRGVTRSRHVVALRSTVAPGVTRGMFREALETASGERAGDGFGLACLPEFLREGSAVADFSSPPFLLIGALDDRSALPIERMTAALERPVHRVSIEEAELIKLVSNAFHALKIGFANEIGRLCAVLGVDPHRVMEIVRSDTKLNASAAYLTPGFAFGGSCLPKDVRLLSADAARRDVTLPILQAVLPSNLVQLEDACRRILALGARRVGVVGLAFKAGTDDLRESPAVELVAALRRHGLELLVHEPDVRIDALSEGSRLYLESRIPDFRELVCEEIEELLRRCDAVVIAGKRPEIAAIASRFGFAGPVLSLSGP